MTWPVPCPYCCRVINARVFAGMELSDEERFAVAQLILDEHRETCRKGDVREQSRRET
jgi:hypothetical protein